MLATLNSGKVVGGAFDVWSEEPPKSEVLKQLIAHTRMVVTPHLGANTFEAQINVAVDVCPNCSTTLMAGRWRMPSTSRVSTWT